MQLTRYQHCTIHLVSTTLQFVDQLWLGDIPVVVHPRSCAEQALLRHLDVQDQRRSRFGWKFVGVSVFLVK